MPLGGGDRFKKLSRPMRIFELMATNQRKRFNAYTVE